jgi:hypothetical protein
MCGQRTIALAAALIVAWTFPVQAVIICYDYAHYRLTGADPTPPGSTDNSKQEADIKAYLNVNRYYVVTERPSGAQLKKDDIVFVTGHIGVVNGPDNIDHYIQIPHDRFKREEWELRGKRYPVNALPAPVTKILTGGETLTGGFFQRDTLEMFFSRRSRRPATYEVWRKCSGVMLLGKCSAR